MASTSKMHLFGRVIKNTKWSAVSRSFTSQTSFIDLTVDKEGIATFTMQRPPANTFNMEYLHEIIKTIDDLSKQRVKGIVLTSAIPNIFSAGLDIKELYNPDLQRLENFYIAVQDVLLKFLELDFAAAAAINGHTPAAGCLLSLACEYRAMVNGNYKIGLNETALGIITTPWMQAVMYQVIQKKDAERALTTAKMFNVDEALQVGLIDEIALDKEDAINRCKQYIKKFDKIPQQARALTKQRIRRTPIKILREQREEDLRMFLDIVMTQSVQDNLRDYFENLKNKKVNK
ncbi:PREDICTED: enoyl-CoA delta isomerase 1, mitochondrial-like [Papilio polytes]|uniref:enoyl-CoA delta isomerase 1, mitochondrial-like n=1 Tax=Papilio polytes TaxID=76194 RepID=UPI0006768E98|nr:PREDICTED: enoyl-CoA delta isomerase 1, mitochondrial-like [Papilio polytes]